MGTTPVEADDIQAVSVEVPTMVVKAVEVDGRQPREVVLELLRAAVAAGDGVIADLPGVLAEQARLDKVVQRLPQDQHDAARAAAPARTTLLDPRRPARDLLEHLLDGLASCHLFFAEYIDDAHDSDYLSDELDAEDNDLSSDVDLRGDEMHQDELAGEFFELVRDQADATHARLV